MTVRHDRNPQLSGYLPIDTKNVAQWLSTADASIGLGLARSQVSALFDDANYQRIFGSFGSDFQSPVYAKLIELVWTGLFVDNLSRRLSERTKVFAKISRLLLVKAVYESIQQSKRLKNFVPDMLTDHRYGRKYLTTPILKVIKDIIASTVAEQKKEQSKDPNIDYSNFFKRNDLIDKAYTIACSPSVINSLANALEKGIAKIQ
jgi:hypothetical protein